MQMKHRIHTKSKSRAFQIWLAQMGKEYVRDKKIRDAHCTSLIFSRIFHPAEFQDTAVQVP